MTMSQQHLKRLHEGRRRASERQRREWVKHIHAYNAWVKRESAAYEALIAARDTYGEHSEQAQQAEADWRFMWSSMPAQEALPSDQMWAQLRGEHQV